MLIYSCDIAKVYLHYIALPNREFFFQKYSFYNLLAFFSRVYSLKQRTANFFLAEQSNKICLISIILINEILINETIISLSWIIFNVFVL